MKFSEHTFDRSALILAWLSLREHRNSHEDLRSYHDAVSKAFSEAFGIDLDVAPETCRIPDENGLHKLFLHAARSYETIRSPFSSFLCGTREISEMYQKYEEPLNHSAAAMRDLHLMMMLELIERIWNDDAPHTVVGKDLEACGHPGRSAPDPFDFW